MGAIQSCVMQDGRLHLHNGPIDLIIDAEGDGRRQAFNQAEEAFSGLLEELVRELPIIRKPADPETVMDGPVARWMLAAVLPFLPAFITPMAAVAGAIADHVLAAMTFGTGLRKAYVNNGGDIAFHLAPGATFSAALPQSRATIKITDDCPWRGLATSGWQGRSHSLGIADAVTVLAGNAAEADAAATLIANNVDLPEHPAVVREPACVLNPDSDLGDRLVTTGVGDLTDEDIDDALGAGRSLASRLLARRLIGAAALSLKDKTVLAGKMPVLEGN